MGNGAVVPIVWSGVLLSLVEQNQFYNTDEGQTLLGDETGPTGILASEA